MMTILVNLYDHVTLLSSPPLTTSKQNEGIFIIHFSLPYLIFKTSKQPFSFPLLHSPLHPSLTLYSPPSPNFHTHCLGYKDDWIFFPIKRKDSMILSAKT